MEALAITKDYKPPKVYITNFIHNHDYNSAREYGEFVNITVGSVNLRELGRVTTDMALIIKDTQKHDYLLLSGINQLCVIAAVLWYQRHGVVNLLCWDKKPNSYKVFVLDMNEIDSLFNRI